MTAYETITAEIVRQLESGVIPWRRPWRSSSTGKLGAPPLPHNHLSGASYRGANLLSLLCAPYHSRAWMTYKQAKTIGGQVRRGEHGRSVMYWRFFNDAKPVQADDRRAPLVRCYTVFNVEQIDGLPLSLPLDGGAAAFEPLDSAQRVLDAYMGSAWHPSLAHGGGSAYYSPALDHVQMPPIAAFYSPHGYYATAFHEFAHSTGHASRLDRKTMADGHMGSESYSDEELVAEFASAFICAECGISNDALLDNSASYIKGWLARLRNESRAVVYAAQRAQKAADFMLGRHAAESAAAELEVAA